MDDTSSPTVWRRWLALELRRMRRESGLDQKEAGRRCGWSGARLSYIESGKQDAREDDLDKLLPLYNVPEERWADYYAAAERSREKGWWEHYRGEMADYMSLFFGLEQGASVLQTYEPTVVPGLLQTPEYTDAILRRSVWPRTDHEIARLVALRAKRQEILTRIDRPTEFAAVLDEATLHHVAKDATTMVGQLTRLTEFAALPHVNIRVLPLERGAQGYTQTGFTIFDFAWESDAMVVYVELRDQAIYLSGQQEIRGFILAFHNLWNDALNEETSLDLIHARIKEFTKT